MPDDQAGRDPTRLTGTETGTESDSLPDTRPGALRGQAWLTLQTRHAGRLIKGRPGSADKQPITGLLGFANPYAYRGSLLLASYDGFARRAFASALGYRFLGIPRVDVARGTAKTEQAVEAMGAVPPEILSGEVRAELAPVRSETADDGIPAFPANALQNAS